MAKPMPQFADARKCPDCGSIAERLGRVTVEHAGGEVVYGWESESTWCACSERHKHAQPYNVHHTVMQFGAPMVKTERRWHFPVDVWCTECNAVAPLMSTEKWTDPLPDRCLEPDGAVSHVMPVFGEGTA